MTLCFGRVDYKYATHILYYITPTVVVVGNNIENDVRL